MGGFSKALAAGALLAAISPGFSDDLKQARFTQVINEVNVLDVSRQAIHSAAKEELFSTPDIIRTGAKSMAELKAPDETLTRVGANTVFSFEPAGRNIKLEQGTLLFHSPKGKGGGNIKSGGASASVLGTTILIVATPGGGFKAILLEGTGRVRFPNGETRDVGAGQMIFVLPNDPKPGPVVNLNLQRLVQGSRLIQGFDQELPSLPRIRQAIDRQVRLIRSGRAEETPLMVVGAASGDSVQVVDATLMERAFSADPRFAGALRFDLIFNGTDFDPRHLFLSPVSTDLVPGGRFVGLAAGNIIFQTRSVDLSPFRSRGLRQFQFFAMDHLVFPTTTVFSDGGSGSTTSPGPFPTTPFDLTLIALRGIFPDSGSDIIGQIGGTFSLFSGGTTYFDDMTIANSFGNLAFHGNDVTFSFVTLFGQGNVDCSAQHLMAFDSLFNANNTVNISSGGGLKLSDSSVFGNFANISGGQVLIDSTYIESTFVKVMSRGDLAILNGGIGSATGPAGILNVNAAGELAMEQVSLSNLSEINLSAHTLRLSYIDFPNGSTVRLSSQNGMLAPNPNTGQPVMPGYVNFVNGVTYGGSPAENFIGSGITLHAR